MKHSLNFHTGDKHNWAHFVSSTCKSTSITSSAVWCTAWSKNMHFIKCQTFDVYNSSVKTRFQIPVKEKAVSHDSKEGELVLIGMRRDWNLICRKLLCAVHVPWENMTKHQMERWKKHELRLCKLADIIQSFCWRPNLCLTPVYTSYCISNLRASWLFFEEAVLKSHSIFPPKSKLYQLPWDVWFQTQGWSKSLAGDFTRSSLIWDKLSRIQV